MKELKVLAIGNSFSQDATHYLHQIAKADGIESKIVNLYIGGCPLETHYNNIEKNNADYLYEINGVSTDNYVTILETLREESWDYIVTQQSSHDSGIQDLYYPYINLIFDYLREKSPNAKLRIQQTWAYEIDSNHGCFMRYHRDQKEMYVRSRAAYQRAAKETGVPLIPCGDAVQSIRTKEPFQYENGGLSLCRDGFHMSYIYGRYLLAATWYEALTGNDIRNNTYIPETPFAPDEIVNWKFLNLINEGVNEVVSNIII